MKPEESSIRSIERKIDEHYKQHDFLKLPASIAIQYLQIAFEYAVSPFIYREEETDPYLYLSINTLLNVNKAAFMEAMNWIGEIKGGEEYKIQRSLNPTIYRSAKEFFELGHSYHGAVSAYTMWSRGLASAELVDNDTVNFKYNPEQIRYDMLDTEYSKKSRDDILGKMGKYDKSVLSAKKIIEKTVKQIDEHNIAYSLRDINTRQMMAVALKFVEGFTGLPDNWGIFGFDRKKLQNFWAALVSIGILHKFAIHYAHTTFSFKNDLLASTIIVRPLKDWVRQLSRWTDLSRDDVEKMLNFHTYSSHHQRPDIVLTPFIKVSDKYLAVSPNLIRTNNLSRNFMKHLAKNYREEFDSNSDVFAHEMLNKLQANISKKNIIVKTNIMLPDRELPDIDVCLIDEDNREIMLCECKWTIPAADPYEVGDKVYIEKEKLNQVARLKEFISQNSKNLSNFIKLGKRIVFEKIFFVIVFENHVGSALTSGEDTPIIDMRIFVDLINTNSSLSAAFEEIKKREYLPKNFNVKQETCEIGKYKILWTGVIQ